MTSRPRVGSSRNSMAGRCRRAAASSDRMRSPRLRLRTGLSRYGARASKSTNSARFDWNSAFRDAVDRLIHEERFHCREIPEQLVPLAHDQGERPEKLGFAIVRGEAQDGGAARGGIQQPGQAFQRGGLAGSVGSQESDHLARCNREADAIDGPDVGVPATETGSSPRRRYRGLAGGPGSA